MSGYLHKLGCQDSKDIGSCKSITHFPAPTILTTKVWEEVFGPSFRLGPIVFGDVIAGERLRIKIRSVTLSKQTFKHSVSYTNTKDLNR